MFTGKYHGLCTHLTVLANGNILHMLLHQEQLLTLGKKEEMLACIPIWWETYVCGGFFVCVGFFFLAFVGFFLFNHIKFFKMEKN